MNSASVLIIGSGQGGFQVAASLRDEGFDGSVTIVGEEPGLPYQRPPLSKAYLTGKALAQQINLRPESFYASRGITLLAPERALRIERTERHVELASGKRLAYDHLVLATGARPRLLSVPGADLDGVLVLRSLAHAEQIRTRLQSAREIVVVGAGFIGLEIAAVARAMGLATHVIDFADRPLKRAVSSATANFLASAHAERGAQFYFSTGIAALAGLNGKVTGLTTSDGRRFSADLVVVGAGVEPNIELAREAGLAVDNGIVVDRHLRTADAAISAIGDCARYPAAYCAQPVRLESVQNAVDQARCVAARLVGRGEPYHKVPWFWSDQGEYKLQIAGLAAESDHAVVRGDMQSGRFSVFRFRAGRLSGVESVNQASDHLAGRKLLAAGVTLTPQQAADAQFQLNSLTG